MSLHLGSNDISKLYLGSQEVEKAYLGSELVFQSVQPTIYTYGFTNPREDDYVIDSSGEYITFNKDTKNYYYPCYYELGDDYMAALEGANYLRYDARIRWKEEASVSDRFTILSLARASSGSNSVSNSWQFYGTCWGEMATYNTFIFRKNQSDKGQFDLADVQEVYPTALPSTSLLEIGWIDLRVEITPGKVEYKFKLPDDTDYVTVSTYENESVTIPGSIYKYITFGGSYNPSSFTVDQDVLHTSLAIGRSSEAIAYEWKAAQEPLAVNGTYPMRNATDQRICVSDAGITRNEAGQIEFGDVNDPFLYIEHPFNPKDLAVNGTITYQIQFRDAVDFKMGFFENWSEEALSVSTVPEFNNGTVLARKSMPGQTGEPISLNLGGVITTGVMAAVQLTRTAEDSYRIVIMKVYNTDTEPVMDTVWDETYTQQDWAQIFPGQSYYFFITSAGGLNRTITAKITGGTIVVGSETYNWTTTAAIDVGV